MDIIDPSIDPKEVELRDVDKKIPEKKTTKRKRLIVDVKITFCTHVGWDGILVLLFSLMIAALFVYITFLYTKGFFAWHRPGVWVFMVFAVLYTLLTLMYLFTWKKIAKSFSKDKTGRRNQSFVGQFLQFKNRFNINGVLFLWKLYLFEFIESINQIINLTTVYLCTLPVEVTTSMCILLSTDAFYRAYQLRQPNTIARRDRQIKIDICIDFLCVAVPLIILWFVFKIPISIPEMIQITLWPTVCLFSKLRSILREIIRARTDNAILREQTKLSFKVNRNRRSIFRTSNSVKISKQQQKRVPKMVSTGYCVYNIVYGLFYLVVAIAHLAMQPTGCEVTTWENGCVNKIPFCNTLFTPKCNCASLKIENNKSLIALPDSLADEMTGLRKVFISNCNLTKLPPNMEQLTEMVDFEISFNRLQEFMVDVIKWEKLNKLHLMYNNITKYNEQALWRHANVAGIGLDGNVGLEIPRTGINMPSLSFLHLGENKVTINTPFHAEFFPNLLDLYLNGNTLEVFPSKTLKDSLSHLGISRCNLKAIPLYLSQFHDLKYLDCRNNNISKVDDELKKLIKQNHVEAYFSGNSVCQTDKSLDCQPLCSETCFSRNAISNDVCDITCNSKECKYDGGKCTF